MGRDHLLELHSPPGSPLHRGQRARNKATGDELVTRKTGNLLALQSSRKKRLTEKKGYQERGSVNPEVIYPTKFLENIFGINIIKLTKYGNINYSELINTYYICVWNIILHPNVCSVKIVIKHLRM